MLSQWAPLLFLLGYGFAGVQILLDNSEVPSKPLPWTKPCFIRIRTNTTTIFTFKGYVMLQISKTRFFFLLGLSVLDPNPVFL